MVCSERLPGSDDNARLAVQAMAVELGVSIYDSMFRVQKIPDVSLRSKWESGLQKLWYQNVLGTITRSSSTEQL